MKFDKYSLYSMNAGNVVLDKVDECVQILQNMKTYKDVVKFITDKFGNIEDKKLIDYKELNKQIEIKFKPDAVEFFAARKWKQYFGKGWKKPKNE